MSNQYYTESSVPGQSSPGTSLLIRAEFAAIRAAFDKLPPMLGNNNKIVTVNGSGTALMVAGVYGTAASVDVGSGTGQIPTLIAPNMLAALDASQLLNVPVNQGGVIDVAHGGTGGTDVPTAQANLGIDLKADAANAVLTGAPVAPTPVGGDDSVRIATTAFVQATVVATGSFAPSNATPLINGVANSGVSGLGSRVDHVHPTDTSRAPLASPVFTGDPQAPTPATADNDTSIATTAYVKASLLADRPFSATSPIIDGTANPGVAANVSRGDHVHPTDTSRAPLASPVFTGDPRAPTPATADNDTSIATTAYVKACLALAPSGILASNVTPLMNGTASAGAGVDGSRYDHVHPTDASRAPVASPTFTGTVSGITAAMVGLSNVDNTSDVNKPVSTAQQTALDLKLSKTSDTGSALIPSGTQAQRDGSPTVGALRHSTTSGGWEGWNGTSWVPQLSGATSKIQPITASLAAGAITINASELSLDFRNASPLTSGAITTVVGTPATLVVATTDSFGDAFPNSGKVRLTVLAMNVGGTIELAVTALNDSVINEMGVVTTAIAATDISHIKANNVRTGVAYRVIGFIDASRRAATDWVSHTLTQGAGGVANNEVESGTFAPAFTGHAGTISTTSATYSKRGNVVTVSIELTGTNIAFTAGAAYINAPPFDCPNNVPAQLHVSAGAAVASLTSRGVANKTTGTAFWLPTSAAANRVHITGTYITT